MLTWLTAAGCVLLVAQIGMLWHLWRVTRGLRRYDQRLGQMHDALGLLTEATESGFRSVASEIERVSPARSAPAAKAASLRRLATAARRGRSHAEIAAAEGLAEGEVALRLLLARQAPDRVNDSRRRLRGAGETTDGALRAK